MKKILLLVAAAAALAGCKTQLPTADQMFAKARLIGASAAMVANKADLDATERAAVQGIIHEANACAPSEGQTFQDLWIKIASDRVQQLFDDSVIDKDQEEAIVFAVTVAAKGFEYFVNVRFSKVKEYEDVTAAAVHGFCDGFLATFKPAELASASAGVGYDKPAYEYIMSAARRD